MASRKGGGKGARRRPSQTWRLRRKVMKALAAVWFVACLASAEILVATGEWRPLFWCGYALYGMFILSI